MTPLDWIGSRTRPLAGLLGAALTVGALAGCGGSGGKGGGGGAKAESEAAPGAATQPAEPGETPADNRLQVEAASEKRERAELAAIKQRRERAERELAARSGQKKSPSSKRKSKGSAGGTTRHKGATHEKRKSSRTGSGGTNRHETTAQQEARKRFEAEEAREAAEYKRLAGKEK